jgi:hypothetical protein
MNTNDKNPSVRDRLAAGEYHTQLRYENDKKAYRLDQSRLRIRFEADILAENGLTNHPKAKLLCTKAWDQGHGSGLVEVLDIFEDLAELLQ